MSENGKIYTTGKNFTLPPALTNSTSALLLTNEKDDYTADFHLTNKWAEMFLRPELVYKNVRYSQNTIFFLLKMNSSWMTWILKLVPCKNILL